MERYVRRTQKMVNDNEKYKDTILFLFLASPLWALTVLGINKLAQHYPHAIDVLPFLSVHYDPISERYMLLGDYELVYPTLLLLVLTLIFLWKKKVSLREFAGLTLVVPIIPLTGAYLLHYIFSSSSYRDDGLLLLVGFYVMPVASFLLGTAVYVICQKLIGRRPGS